MLNKTSGIIAAVVCVILTTGAVTGGFFLKNKLDSIGKTDVATESQKVLLIGTYKEVDGNPMSLTVRMTPSGGHTVERSLEADDFKYDTGGQQSDKTMWIDLKSWAMAISNDTALDVWTKAGGVIDVQAFCGTGSSVRKQLKYGGGSYFVREPKDDHSVAIEYMPVVLQLTGEDIS